MRKQPESKVNRVNSIERREDKKASLQTLKNKNIDLSCQYSIHMKKKKHKRIPMKFKPTQSNVLFIKQYYFVRQNHLLTFFFLFYLLFVEVFCLSTFEILKNSTTTNQSNGKMEKKAVFFFLSYSSNDYWCTERQTQNNIANCLLVNKCHCINQFGRERKMSKPMIPLVYQCNHDVEW